MAVLFKDYSKEVNKKINELGVEWLEQASGKVEKQTKQNTKVDTGKTKGSWEHIVHDYKLEAEVGSRYMNAVWEEYGTGIHAEGGKGRQDVPWVYKAPDGSYHKTSGKKPRQAFRKAYASTKNTIIRLAQSKFRGIK